ncbi:hypothetical protein [uncultured Selenomonas sp.]|uniref:hypothetical protein n=1 Tax=uncultured Selenomonas sp. TaxID=159275 RepID=UPI0028038DA6|nr:hypothetical protein [uncultured Selenomonas sp.]
MDQTKEQRKKQPFDERQERVKHLYNTMRRSLQMKEEKEWRNDRAELTNLGWIAALAAIAVLLFLLWKCFG